MMCGGVIGIEVKCALEFVFGGYPVVIEKVQQFGKGIVGFGKLTIKSECLFQGLASPPRIIGKEINIGQPGVGRRIVGILLDRSLKVCLGLFVAVSLVEEKTPFEIVIVGLGIHGGDLVQDRLFMGSQFNPNLVGDGARRLFLQ